MKMKLLAIPLPISSPVIHGKLVFRSIFSVPSQVWVPQLAAPQLSKSRFSWRPGHGDSLQSVSEERKLSLRIQKVDREGMT